MTDHPASLTTRAHAKINLSLHVAGVRPDGYHLLKTVFQSLALHDTLTVEPSDGPFVLSCSAPGVPADERNLAWKAASLYWRASGREGDVRGLRIRIAKRIPAQGGLGGGSADAAATLLALNGFWQGALSGDALYALARQLGADVPFFLCGGTALGLDRGDDMYPLADLPPYTVVLVFPDFGVSTPEAFRWWDEEQASSGSEVVQPPIPSGPLPVVRLAGDVGLPIVNELQGPVVRKHPVIGEVCDRLRAAGAAAAAMTGSGSTVFGLFTAEACGAAAATALEQAGWRTLLTRTVSRAEALGPAAAFTGRGPLV